MSVLLTDKVIHLSTALTPSGWALLVAMADIARDDGWSPTAVLLFQLGYRTRLAPQDLEDALHELAAKGLVKLPEGLLDGNEYHYTEFPYILDLSDANLDRVDQSLKLNTKAMLLDGFSYEEIAASLYVCPGYVRQIAEQENLQPCDLPDAQQKETERV